MKRVIAIVSLSIGVTLSFPIQKNNAANFFSRSSSRQVNLDRSNSHTQLVAQAIPLQPIELNDLANLGIDEQLWTNPDHRQSLLQAIDRSLSYLDTPTATQAYQNYPVPGFTLERVKRSLVRFRQVLLSVDSPTQLQELLQKEFVFYQSVGTDHRGTVEFTGYYEPIFSASIVPTAQYRYPLYRKPANFDSWSQPHPTRVQLEGEDGLLGNKSILSGYEIVWLRDRLEAFLVQVQGSARLQLTDGRTMTVGYGGSTDYPYTSIGGELVKEGVFTKEELSLPKLMAYFQAHPEALDQYISRNNRFIFLQETQGQPPIGSLGVPVTGDRSIATDKSIMPPGALALIVAPIPLPNQAGELETRLVSRYVLDQDTGSAIKGTGRVDIFLGTGKLAGDRAGLLNGTGQLYYLLLKE
jgi:membrane-bound lytic murein transglycosylase A